ncbi:hypothetical protein ACVWW1_002640 [Bradyrhizobium sp. JR3.5]
MVRPTHSRVVTVVLIWPGSGRVQVDQETVIICLIRVQIPVCILRGRMQLTNAWAEPMVARRPMVGHELSHGAAAALIGGGRGS